MKITQSKDYKKPFYAIGIAAALTAVAVTGCGGEKTVQYAGELQPETETTEEVQLAGEETICDKETESVNSKPDADTVVLAGSVEFANPDTEN